ncbi:LPS export ABC transporter periplasmic protein LptC [Orrella marina]|uniref:LPS export ABC transporter periplasmic protein LptC n=1 Tax=Orrella marina TaxID=2163011 RepID=A0A2R4XL47_9BURK|nr:LPS export ABC transporter periplasmic protein LptC [Orrella marina]AWB34503.1 LPS export ABC transporter periplasmic protein LptC [Orrella marina]
MKDRLPTIASILILIALVIGTWIAAEYTTRAVELDAPARATHDPDTWARNVTIIRTNETGLAYNRLEGDYMEHFPDDDSYEIQLPRAFNMQPDSPVTVATSNTAAILDQGDRILMKGDAVMIRLGDEQTEPLNITSDEIHLLAEEDVAYTELPAVAVRGMSRLSGTGMHYDNKTRELNVYKSSDLEIAPRMTQEGSESE